MIFTPLLSQTVTLSCTPPPEAWRTLWTAPDLPLAIYLKFYTVLSLNLEGERYQTTVAFYWNYCFVWLCYYTVLFSKKMAAKLMHFTQLRPVTYMRWINWILHTHEKMTTFFPMLIVNIPSWPDISPVDRLWKATKEPQITSYRLQFKEILFISSFDIVFRLSLKSTFYIMFKNVFLSYTQLID